MLLWLALLSTLLWSVHKKLGFWSQPPTNLYFWQSYLNMIHHCFHFCKPRADRQSVLALMCVTNKNINPCIFGFVKSWLTEATLV